MENNRMKKIFHPISLVNTNNLWQENLGYVIPVLGLVIGILIMAYHYFLSRNDKLTPALGAELIASSDAMKNQQTPIKRL
jgi:hypothetical protein